MSAANLLTGLAFLAAFNEWVIELLFGKWENPRLNKLLIYFAAAVGVLECWLLELDALPLAGLTDTAPLGFIITGIVIGAGSNALHKFFMKTSREG